MKKIMKMKKGRMMHKTLKKSTMLCTVMSEDSPFLVLLGDISF